MGIQLQTLFLLKVHNAHRRKCWNLLTCRHFFTRSYYFTHECLPPPQMQEFVDLQTLFYTFVLFHPNFIDTCHELRPLTKTFSNVLYIRLMPWIKCTALPDKVYNSIQFGNILSTLLLLSPPLFSWKPKYYLPKLHNLNFLYKTNVKPPPDHPLPERPLPCEQHSHTHSTWSLLP